MWRWTERISASFLDAQVYQHALMLPSAADAALSTLWRPALSLKDSSSGRTHDLLAAGVVAPPLQAQNGHCRLSFPINSPPAQSEQSWFQRSSSWNLTIWTLVFANRPTEALRQKRAFRLPGDVKLQNSAGNVTSKTQENGLNNAWVVVLYLAAMVIMDNFPFCFQQCLLKRNQGRSMWGLFV